MDPNTVNQFVFVDFENVPSVDLELTAEKPVHVTLLIGEKQQRLELALVRQIHRHASQVTLIEVGASGRNALDLVLACHLGKAVAQQVDATFYIVSKDKDFDPLISHLRQERVQVSRHNAFAELPCLTPPRPKSSPAGAAAPADKLERLIATLAKPNRSRPKRKKSLLAHINARWGNTLSDDEQVAMLDELMRRGVLRLDDQGRVTY